MSQPPSRLLEVYVVDDIVHVRVDAPGERAVSTPVTDVLALIKELAEKADFEVDEGDGEIYISWPSG
jgi:hypothetical protein